MRSRLKYCQTLKVMVLDPKSSKNRENYLLQALETHEGMSVCLTLCCFAMSEMVGNFRVLFPS